MWKSKTTERIGRRQKKKKIPHKQNQTLARKIEGINLCKSDTAFEKMPGLTILIMANCTLVASREAKVNHIKKS